jgi:aspartyl-tRNA(Asn)/glutamyl-tRNA(Gln) amidotransferase subunit A
VGVKPSYGRVSRFGLVAYASSLDQIGPMTKTVEDAAILLGAISGGDVNDSTCLDEPVPDYTATLNDSIQGMKLGLPKEYFGHGMEASVREAVEAAAKQYEELGAEIVEVSLPHTEQAVGVYYIIATAEASANLARFDAVRYGYRSPNANNLAEQYAKSRDEGFGDEVKLRILLGTYVLCSGYYDAYYVRAQKLRTLIRQDFTQAFEKVDALITPATPSPAFKIGEKISNPLEMYLADINTISANLAGICGISLPCGFAKPTDGGETELPIGLQILGAPFAESTILRLAHQYEQATEWHQRRPNLN